jgi:hypothetical protein
MLPATTPPIWLTKIAPRLACPRCAARAAAARERATSTAQEEGDGLSLAQGLAPQEEGQRAPREAQEQIERRDQPQP